MLTERLNGQASRERFDDCLTAQWSRLSDSQQEKLHTSEQFNHYKLVTVSQKSTFMYYSFALKPEEHQPSGTCNFSRIDNAKMEFGSTGAPANTSNVNVYAVNYNVLRIMSGMGGLAYSELKTFNFFYCLFYFRKLIYLNLILVIL